MRFFLAKGRAELVHEFPLHKACSDIPLVLSQKYITHEMGPFRDKQLLKHV